MSVTIAAVVVTGCSAPRDGATPGQPTVTVTYSSSTSNAPTTQTVTSSPSSTSRPGASTTSSSGTPSSSAAATGTAPTSSSTSGASTPSQEQHPRTAAEYADAFVRAWGRGDRAAASIYGSSAAVSALFDQVGSGGGGWERTTLTAYAGSTQVGYSDGRRTLDLVVDHGALGAGDDHAVTSAVLTVPDASPTPPPGDGLPTTSSGYADTFVRAWGAGDATAWDYASDGAQGSLSSGPGPNAGSWTRTSSTPTSASYRDRDGSVLVLSLDSARVSAGQKDAITGATRT